MLPDSLIRFILHRKIYSFLRNWFLLFPHQHSQQDRISREYVRQVTFTDAPTPDELNDELQEAGLLIYSGEVLRLKDALELRSELDTMAHVIEDPTGRQKLLRRLYRHTTDSMEKNLGNVTLVALQNFQTGNQVDSGLRRHGRRQDDLPVRCINRRTCQKDGIDPRWGKWKASIKRLLTYRIRVVNACFASHHTLLTC